MLQTNTDKNLSNNNFFLSPYNFLVKKYYLKKKKVNFKKYKNRRNRLFVNNVYSYVYKHKIYSLNYYLKFFENIEKDNLKKYPEKTKTLVYEFNYHRFYFFNFSGLFYQGFLKNNLLYTIH